MHQAVLVGSEGVAGWVFGMPKQPIQKFRMANPQTVSRVVTAS